MSAPGDPSRDDLVGDLIAEIARTHGIAISRDDPVIAVVLLNQLVLRRYLEEAVAPAAAAIREATRDAVAEIEQFAQVQAHWLEQVSLKDRSSFIEEQSTLHATWKADMETLIAGQNGALQRVVSQTATLLRTRTPSPAPPSSAANMPTLPPRVLPWGSIITSILAVACATLALTLLAGLTLTGH